MLGKILDFICTGLRSTEIALDSLWLVQYDFCRTKTRANKIPYFTKHCRITYYYSSKIREKLFCLWVILEKDVSLITNSEDPDQTAPLGAA